MVNAIAAGTQVADVISGQEGNFIGRSVSLLTRCSKGLLWAAVATSVAGVVIAAFTYFFPFSALSITMGALFLFVGLTSLVGIYSIKDLIPKHVFEQNVQRLTHVEHQLGDEVSNLRARTLELNQERERLQASLQQSQQDLQQQGVLTSQLDTLVKQFCRASSTLANQNRSLETIAAQTGSVQRELTSTREAILASNQLLQNELEVSRERESAGVQSLQQLQENHANARRDSAALRAFFANVAAMLQQVRGLRDESLAQEIQAVRQTVDKALQAVPSAANSDLTRSVALLGTTAASGGSLEQSIQSYVQEDTMSGTLVEQTITALKKVSHRFHLLKGNSSAQ